MDKDKVSTEFIAKECVSLRKGKLLSVAGIARDLGVSRETIYKIERGNFSVASNVLIGYLSLLGIDLRDLFGGLSRTKNSMFTMADIRSARVKW